MHSIHPCTALVYLFSWMTKRVCEWALGVAKVAAYSHITNMGAHNNCGPSYLEIYYTNVPRTAKEKENETETRTETETETEPE